MIKDVLFTENRLGECDLSTYADDFGDIFALRVLWYEGKNRMYCNRSKWNG